MIERSEIRDFKRYILRDGAVVARWAHNPKVSRSSRLPATKVNKVEGRYLTWDDAFLFCYIQTENNHKIVSQQTNCASYT